MDFKDKVNAVYGNQNEDGKLRSASSFFPWRRYFARGLDLLIYDYLFKCFSMVVLGYDSFSGEDEVFYIIMLYVVMVLIEPLLLAKFGTTFGKFIFGIYIRDLDEKLMTYSSAFKRTYTLIVMGLGLGIPVISLMTLIKSYSKYRKNEYLAWEDNSNIYLKDTKVLRIFAFLVVVCLMIFMIAFTTGVFEMPVS